MKRPGAIAFTASLLLLPSLGSSAQSLREVMRGWRADERSLFRMASSQAKFDEPAARATLQTLATEADNVQAQLKSNTAAARDFKAMFGALAATAQATMPDLGNYPAFKAQVRNIRASCSACHNKYRN